MKGTGCDETDQNRLYNGVSDLQGDLAVGIIQKNRSMREMKNRESKLHSHIQYQIQFLELFFLL